MVNRVILIGNLGREPEVRHLESGSVVAKFPVATNESYKDKAGEWQTITEWHDIVVWRQLAERAERDLKKGSLVYIEGKLTKRKWQDKDGNDRYTTEVVANTFRLLERRDANRASNFPTAEDEIPAVKESAPQPSVEADQVEDDLPF